MQRGVSLELKTIAMVLAVLAAFFVLLVTVLDNAPPWQLAVALVGVLALVALAFDIWVYRPIHALIRRSRERLGGNYERSDPGYRDELQELGYLVGTLIAVFTAAEDKEWVSQAVRDDLMRVQETKRQLVDVGEIGAEINAALPYKETVERALLRAKGFLRADAVALIRLDVRARAFVIEGSAGLEDPDLSADCCSYATGCPVRSAITSGEVRRVTNHSCALFPATLAAQIALPVSVAGVGDLCLHAAATAWDHFGDVGPEVFAALQGHLQSALGNAHKYDHIRRQVVTDHLTGVYNRRHFLSRGREEMDRSLRYQSPLSVLMMDIDHFKAFNDDFGHATGDRVLQAVAGILRKGLRTSDVCARLGGEEFALLLPETPGDGAIRVAERIRSTLAETRYTGLGLPPDANITISVGVATCPRDATGFDELVELADKALYVAKAEGRDRVRQHGTSMRAQVKG